MRALQEHHSSRGRVSGLPQSGAGAACPYATIDDSKEPENLKAITEAPVPEDPATGKPLEYRRDGDGVMLSLPESGMKGRPLAPYRITIRKLSDKKNP